MHIVKDSALIVSFQIGRGGKFYNPNHLTYVGEKDLPELINMRDNELFVYDKDEDGNDCDPFVMDGNGNDVCSEINDTGTLNFDGVYDTMYAKKVEDCDSTELDVIAQSEEIKSAELEDYLQTIALELAK